HSHCKTEDVEVGDHNVLLVRCDGVYSAISNQCTHYGAPLSKGVLSGHRVRCPWHGSCFNVKTGDLEEYPGIDCLPCHKACITIYFLSNHMTISELYFVQALSIDTNKKTLTFDDDLIQCYDQILIATGSKSLDCPGVDLENVLMLETPEDARCIHYACMGCRTVVVGTSFVGMEVAAYMIDMASSITIIGSSELPYQKTLGPEIGKVLEERGVTFYMNDAVAEVQGENRRVKAVKLKSGITIEADLLIVGIGMYSRQTECFLNLNNLNNSSNLTLPKSLINVSIGHWQTAQAHGRIAALNMMRREVELNIVPFYWTVLLGRTIRYAGYGEGYTEMVLKGRFENMKFLALYLKDDEVVAAAGLNVEPAVSVVAERLAEGRVITKAEAE
uniref:Apoptosis inducing factor mitochondria associated 5 n=1 Tax=Sinocyclocheilus rhinocerous TaxID=307959 RepID=A0A673M940_9TELE